MSNQAAATAEKPVEAAPAPKSLLKKLKIPGIIAAVVVAEWIAASLFLPGGSSKDQTTAAAAEHADEEHADDADAKDDHGAAEHGAKPKEAKPAHGEKPKEEPKGHGEKAEPAHGEHGKPAASKPVSEQVEVDLGEFTVTVYHHTSSSTQFISFHLFGTIRGKHLDEFGTRFDESKHRIRDNVIVIVRSAEMTDLTDAGLGLIKRRILETTNKTLGKPLLQGVVFSDFSFIEQ